MGKTLDQITPEDDLFGRRLTEYLRWKHIKQKVLAAKLGMSPPSIHHYLYGIRRMKIDVFARTVYETQMEPDDVMYLLSTYYPEENKNKTNK